MVIFQKWTCLLGSVLVGEWMLGIWWLCCKHLIRSKGSKKSWKIYELLVCYTRLGSILKPTKGAGGATTRHNTRIIVIQYSSEFLIQSCHATLDISGSPTDFLWGSRKKSRATLTGMLITKAGHVFQSTNNLDINPLTPVKQQFIKFVNVLYIFRNQAFVISIMSFIWYNLTKPLCRWKFKWNSSAICNGNGVSERTLVQHVSHSSAHYTATYFLSLAEKYFLIHVSLSHISWSHSKLQLLGNEY